MIRTFRSLRLMPMFDTAARTDNEFSQKSSTWFMNQGASHFIAGFTLVVGIGTCLLHVVTHVLWHLQPPQTIADAALSLSGGLITGLIVSSLLWLRFRSIGPNSLLALLSYRSSGLNGYVKYL